MAALGVNIKYVTNLAKQIDDLNKFGDQIVATTAGAAKLANTLGGGKLLQSANNLAAAIDKIGGVSKLTSGASTRSAQPSAAANGTVSPMPSRE